MADTQKDFNGAVDGANRRVSSPIRLVVRRGAFRRFHLLQRRTARMPVIVSWDRRQGERRQAGRSVDHDRRVSDRRQATAFTWDLADFAVVFDTPGV